MKLTSFPSALCCILLMLVPIAGRGAETAEPSAAELRKALNDHLHFQTGEVTLPGGLASLSLPEAFHYLPPTDAEFVLTKLWRNPPGRKTLGMHFPTGTR